MRYTFRVNGKPISSDQAIKLSKIDNILMRTVRREVTFTWTLQGLLRFAWAIEKEYAVRFVNVRIIDMLEEMKVLKFLAGSSRVTYILYITVEKKFKHKGVLSVHVKLKNEAPVKRNSSLRTLMNQSSTSLLRRISLSWFRMLKSSLRTNRSLPLSTPVCFILTPGIF